MSHLGALAAAVFAVTIPLIYYYSTVVEMRHALAIETAFFAKSVEKTIQDSPDMWRFEKARLTELASQPSFSGKQDEREIWTSGGAMLVKTDFVAQRPCVTVLSTLFD